jgi:4-amino-4-deoxy-L-arabinose transferase-like glycosyltransferase
MLENIFRWFAARPRLTLVLAVAGLFGPFLAKPFNIDDPLFIRLAQQVWLHPFDPFGFDINWYGVPCPMWDATENPPLAGYYLALAGGLLGWSETALHFAFLFPTVAVAWGTHRLAQRFCRRPLLAALATLAMPVFVISGTTLMCDMLMLAFWIWAMVFWMEGLEPGRGGKLLLAAMLMMFAMFTKYFGVCVMGTSENYFSELS